MALAPLTNIALAIRQDPDFGKKLKSVTIMGGNTQGTYRDSSKKTFVRNKQYTVTSCITIQYVCLCKISIGYKLFSSNILQLCGMLTHEINSSYYHLFVLAFY